MLDQTWAATNAGGSARTARVTDELVAPTEWYGVMTQCLGPGFSTSSLAYSVGPNGYFLGLVDQQEPSEEQQVRWAMCAYRHQIDPVAAGFAYSVEQVRYLWRYNREWLIPCLETHGAKLVDLPTWDDYRDAPDGIRWTPYDSVKVASDGSLLMNDDRAPLLAACGAPLGMLDTAAAG